MDSHALSRSLAIKISASLIQINAKILISINFNLNAGSKLKY